MNRVLLSIGCNQYAYMDCLHGAEADASRLYRLLVNEQIGDYNSDLSALLLSPSRRELEDKLDLLLDKAEPIDTFTFYFAGHGAVKAGSYYMATADSRKEMLSGSAFSLSQILLRVGERAPTQTFIIIDSCQSGGLSNDLNSIVKSSVLGDEGTPAVTLFSYSGTKSIRERSRG